MTDVTEATFARWLGRFDIRLSLEEVMVELDPGSILEDADLGAAA